jgi:rubrerythrin
VPGWDCRRENVSNAKQNPATVTVTYNLFRFSIQIFNSMSKNFKDLTAQELLAVAIQAEEEDGRVYADLAARVGRDYPATAKSLLAMHEEENGHRHRLLNLYRERYGEHIPLIRRQDVKGFIARKPIWLNKILTISMIRNEVESMETESRNFYQAAIPQTTDASVRQLLGDLAAEEEKHYQLAEEMDEKQKASGARRKEDDSERRRFVLQTVQPGLAGLMDGSVSTLAPVFAAALATHNSWDAFLVGMAASLGAGISMGFAEAMSDDGVLSGRGRPWARGAVCGLMTTAGGIGHTLPFLIGNFYYAMCLAMAIVIVELGVIAWIRHRYMDTPLIPAAIQVIIGGILVFAVGILIGSA